MITQRELANIVKRTKEASAKVRVVFRGMRYALVIDGFIRAEGPGGERVEWGRAFGSLTPAEALVSLPIEFIEVSLPSRSFVLKSLRELVKWAT